MISKTLSCAGIVIFSAFPGLCDEHWQPDRYLVKEELSVDYLDLELTDQVQIDTVFANLPEHMVRWDINWDASCNVSLEISALVPRLVNTTRQQKQQTLDVKNAQLFEFVMQHARLARYAAEEIKRNGCQNASYINPYWEGKAQQLTNERIEIFSD